MISIRGAELEDYDAIAVLVREADELHAQLLPGYFRKPRRPSRTREDLVKILQDKDERLLLAEADGVVAGLAHVQLYDTPAFAFMVPKRRAHMDNLIVSALSRRRGIGRMLVSAATEWARAHDASELLLTVWAGNVTAEQFYAELGFRRVSSVLGIEL